MPFDGSPGRLYREAVEAPVEARVRGNPTRFGCAEPRIVTPPLRELTPETSLGFEVVEFARDVLRIELLPWQKALLVRALELLPDGSLRFRTVVVLVARQNGKSLVSQVLALWWLYVVGCRTVLGTAQDLDTAEEVWDGAVDLIEANPDLAALADKPIRVNGKKAIRLLSGERYKVKAASRKAGRGLTGHRVMLDELREHQTWDAWGAITKTLRTISDGQVWCFSNAGDVTSVVLRALRIAAHRALGDPDGVVAQAGAEALGPDDFELDEINAELDGDDPDAGDLALEDFDIEADDLFLAEWSTDPDRPITDRDGWAQSNPSLGYLVSERTMASECRTDPEHVFRTEALCQWVEGAITGPFPAGAWEQTTNVPAVTPSGEKYVADEDRIVGDVVAAVAVSYNRERSYVAFAGHRADGLPQGEIVAARPGVEWLGDWLMDPRRRARIKSVTGQSNGEPTGPVLAALRLDREFTLPIVDLAGADLTSAFGRVHDAVRDGKVRHNRQPPLDRAASTAALRRLTGGDVIDERNSPVDAAPLSAWVYAVNALLRPVAAAPPPPPPPRAVKSLPERNGIRQAFDVTTAGF